MSSPPHMQSFRDLSPAGAPGMKRSRFTYRHIQQLAASSTSCPLRVIAHLDLDCFYAQVEMVRLGIPDDKPVAVQQWQGLIAVNYPARSFGIGRHCNVSEAKKLCPDLIHQHVATWREGDAKWDYHPDAAANMATHKVSLDPYRLESRKILAIIKEELPPHLQKVEKASIDEVFMDLSAQVHTILLERFPELANPPPYDDPTEMLPMPSITALDWQADALVDLPDENAELEDPDWDDVAILIGSEIVRKVRIAIKDKLGYTCSAGVACNKLLSKLGSAYRKPNQQTVLRNRSIQHFLSDFKFTKMRNLGGKLGEQISQIYHTDTVKDLLSAPVEQLKSKLGDDTGVWVYNTVRGIDTSEVNPRVQIKSMLSAKSFRPSITSFEQAVRWLRIFAADIFSRLVEEGVLENKRRPKTINLHHRHGTQTRSRQGPIPQGRKLDEESLLELARNLLSQIVSEGQVWPCSNLSLSVGGFEDGVTGNMGIGAFLLKGEEAQASKMGSGTATVDSEIEIRPAEKRRRLDNGGIERFFAKRELSHGANSGLGSDDTAISGQSGQRLGTLKEEVMSGEPAGSEGVGKGDEVYNGQSESEPGPIITLTCSRCNASLDSPEELQSHQDWHFAKELQEQERVSQTFVNQPSASSSRAGNQISTRTTPKRQGRPKKVERGQSKLKFG
ncbi:DNA/RNA polymerase [Neurospora hispaniola]|uniref:DNA polymerase eta n=1 Tax=Neurospora hispaniola TaxID=588809 RepID=A0AAJ0I3L6_9PEZI|nr:DNA/RNA polymerase [Neurospora hispaniola]